MTSLSMEGLTRVVEALTDAQFSTNSEVLALKAKIDVLVERVNLLEDEVDRAADL